MNRLSFREYGSDLAYVYGDWIFDSLAYGKLQILKQHVLPIEKEGGVSILKNKDR